MTRGGGALVRDGGSGGIFSDADDPDDAGSGGILSDADELDAGSGGILSDADEPPVDGTGGGILIDADEPPDGSGGIVVPRAGGAVVDRIGAGGTLVCVPDAERVRGNGATSPCATASGAVIRAGAATLGGLNMRSSPGSLESGLWLETISMSSLTAVDSVFAMFTTPADVAAQDCERVPIAQAKSGRGTDELRERVA